MHIRNKKNFLKIIFISLFCFSSLYAQEKLSFLNTSWSNIIPGTVVAEPAVTSYGFCVATDGRMLSAFSNNGVLLWEKSTSSSKDVSITALPEDFTILWDNKKSEIKVLNPSGKIIWTKSLSYKLNKKPYAGRDGRFFISGDNVIECYGINGICKWSIETVNQKKLPLQELSDGSIILFLQECKGKTKALRISPFGKLLEEITFTGEVKNAITTKDGVYLIFTDGSSGLFSVVNGLSKNKWVLNKKSKNSTLLVSENEYVFLELLSNKVIVDKINYKDGTVTETFEIENINGNDLKLSELTSSGIIIADSKNCYLYSLDGSKKWSALMPEQKSGNKWNYVFFTNDNHLVFCLEDWSINAYLTSQIFHSNNKSKKSNYNNYYKIDTKLFDYLYTEKINNDFISDERYKDLSDGYYGEKEIEYASDLYSILSAYLSEKTKLNYADKKVSVFDLDAYGMQCSFSQLALYGTSDSASYFAKLLSNTTEKIYIKTLLSGISKCGYDPDGKILDVLERIVPTFNHNDNDLLKLSCDAVSSICLFMGRPAFNTKGKEILKKLLYPSYESNTRDYAIKTLEKIINMDL